MIDPTLKELSDFNAMFRIQWPATDRDERLIFVKSFHEDVNWVQLSRGRIKWQNFFENCDNCMMKFSRAISQVKWLSSTI
jgi:hypothetical protein